MSNVKISDEAWRFFVELYGLCRRHGVAINGCGCCGSPWLRSKSGSIDFENVCVKKDGVTIDGSYVIGGNES